MAVGPSLSGLPWNDHFTQYALAAIAFDWVLQYAFHMGEDVVQFSLAFHDVPLEMRTYHNPFYNWNPGSLFANYGGDDDYKYWLFCDTPDDEEFVSEKEKKRVFTLLIKRLLRTERGCPSAT